MIKLFSFVNILYFTDYLNITLTSYADVACSLKNTGKYRYNEIGVKIMYEKLITRNRVPCKYISADTPSKVIADIKLAIKENATGNTLCFLSPRRYSCKNLCIVLSNLSMGNQIMLNYDILAENQIIGNLHSLFRRSLIKSRL